MTNQAQTPTQDQQPNKNQSSYQNNPASGKVGSNIQKDEPLSQKKAGGMKGEGESCSSSQSSNKASNA